MQKSPEERISSLEESIIYLKEGMAEVKNTLEKIMDKLDDRYPSKESMDLRISTLRDELKDLHDRTDKVESQTAKMQRWQYQVTGAVMLAAFLLGLLARSVKW